MKERYQNPVIGDTLRLRVFSYNSNARMDFQSVEKVEIYFLDENARNESNPKGLTLIDTIQGSSIVNSEVGLYEAQTVIERDKYSIGNYQDVWYVSVEQNEPSEKIVNDFQIYPNLWMTCPAPIIYDFNFTFRPNKIRKGSRRYIIIEVTPNVPNESDLKRYYTNLAIVSPLKINIEQACGDCLPEESDLRLVVEDESVELREQTNGYYLLDTAEFDEGIYNVWFSMVLGENIYISDKQQLSIF